MKNRKGNTRFILFIISIFLSFSFSNENYIEQLKNETTVLVCTGSYSKRYHKYECRGLKACKASVKRISISDAQSRGYSACRNCYR